ncbi:unnamed protein product [Tilletia controversa]|nr:unnamed protein product [Tilletia controversa]CAD6936139.1 unnamed protein product [Tilletia controversa]CAD6975527.1 unnamed protein product [Tilletia controversa]
MRPTNAAVKSKTTERSGFPDSSSTRAPGSRRPEDACLDSGTATQVLTHASDVESISAPAGKRFRTAATNNKGGKLTAEQFSHHLKSNLCFGCFQSGHTKTDCPRRQQASSNHSQPAYILDEDDDEDGGTAEAHGVILIDSSTIKPVDGGESMALPLKLMIRIGGKLAYTLVDDGCTHNLIKPSLVKLHQLAYHRYPDPLALKQTTVGLLQLRMMSAWSGRK